MPLHVEPASPLGSLARDSLREAVKAVVHGASSWNTNTTTGNVWLTKLGQRRMQVLTSDGPRSISAPIAVSVPPALVSELSLNASVWLLITMIDSSVVDHMSRLSENGPVAYKTSLVGVSLLQETQGAVSVAQISNLLDPIAIRLKDDIQLDERDSCCWFDPAGQVWSYAGTEIPTVWQLRALDIAPVDGTWCLASHLSFSVFAIATLPATPLPADSTLLVSAVSISAFVIVSACAGLLYYRAYTARKRSKAKEMQQQRQKDFEDWYPLHRHTIFSIMQTALDDGAQGLVLLKVAMDQPGSDTEMMWTDLQEDLRRAWHEKKRPFADGRFDFRDLKCVTCSRRSRLSDELRYQTQDERFVIIVSCIDSEVAAVKTDVRNHNTTRHQEQGKAKFAWSSPTEMAKASSARSNTLRKKKAVKSIDIRSFPWYQHYKFTVYGIAQTAVDEGATGVKLLGVQPDHENIMTYMEFPAFEEDWREAEHQKVFPYIVVGREPLLGGIEFEFLRTPQQRLCRDLQQLTEDGCHVLVMSCRGEDEVDVVKEIIHFNQNRPEGHGEVKRAWATPDDMYAERVSHRDNDNTLLPDLGEISARENTLPPDLGEMKFAQRVSDCKNTPLHDPGEMITQRV